MRAAGAQDQETDAGRLSELLAIQIKVLVPARPRGMPQPRKVLRFAAMYLPARRGGPRRGDRRARPAGGCAVTPQGTQAYAILDWAYEDPAQGPPRVCAASASWPGRWLRGQALREVQDAGTMLSRLAQSVSLSPREVRAGQARD